MKLHVLTLTWNGKEKLENLKPGLFTNFSSFGAECHWHIRDNGSKDGTDEFVNFAHFYKIDHNRDSFAKGVNFLFEKANPSDDDLILLLNNDVTFGDSDSLLKMYKLMDKCGAAVVGARLLYNDSDKIQHGGVIFSKKYGNMPWHYRRGEKSDKEAIVDRYFQAVTAAVCMVKASSFRRVGGLDQNYWWAFEDIDFNLKIGQEEKIAYCGSTKIFHEESASLNKNPINKMFLNNNVNHFKTKWFGKYKIDHDLYLNDPHYNEIKR